MSTFCTHCGESLRNAVRFCEACGQPVQQAVSQQPDRRAPQPKAGRWEYRVFTDQWTIPEKRSFPFKKEIGMHIITRLRDSADSLEWLHKADGWERVEPQGIPDLTNPTHVDFVVEKRGGFFGGQLGIVSAVHVKFRRWTVA